MTTKPYHRHYTGRNAKALATNPIARAIARAKLRQSILDLKCAIYLMENGDDCRELCEGIAQTLAVMGYAADIDDNVASDDPQLRVLQGGISACQQMLATGKWAKINAVALEVALDAAVQLNDKLKAESINTAWHVLTKKEM